MGPTQDLAKPWGWPKSRKKGFQNLPGAPCGVGSPLIHSTPSQHTLLSAPAMGLVGFSSQKRPRASSARRTERALEIGKVSPKVLKPQPPGSVSQGWEGAGQVGGGDLYHSAVVLNDSESLHHCLSSPPQILTRAIFVGIRVLSCPREESEHQISSTVYQRYARPTDCRQEMPFYTPVRKKGRGRGRSASTTFPGPTLSWALSLPKSFQHPLSIFSHVHLGQPGPGVVSHEKEHTEKPVENKTLDSSGEKVGDKVDGLYKIPHKSTSLNSLKEKKHKKKPFQVLNLIATPLQGSEVIHP